MGLKGRGQSGIVALVACLWVAGLACAPYQNATVLPPEGVLAPPAPPVVTPQISPAAQPPLASPGVAAPSPALEPTAPIYREIPSPMRLQDRVAIILQPEESISSVRSEVILVASVLGSDGYLRTNEPVHWHLDPNGVGQIVDVCPGAFVDWLVGDFTRPRKVSNHYAVTSTSRRYLLLTRGTVNPEDDLSILAGQTWISVSSAVEGTSIVTVFAPGVRDWTRRTQTARIHWVDAQWTFPSPAIVPAGSRHQLVTTVSRQSDQAPRVGWVVRYQVRSGPPAGFLPGGEAMVEVVTNEAGQAIVEIAEQQPVAGTTTIGVELVKPDTLDSSGRPLVVGRGTTHITWSSPGLTLRKLGPATMPAGGTIQYRIEIANPGDLPAADVTVIDSLPEGLSLSKSSPEPSENLPGQRQLRWKLGTLASGESRVVTLECIAERPGRIENIVTATAHGGLQARSSAVTEVRASGLQLRVKGPSSASLNETVRFVIELTNGAAQPLPGLVLRARFDRGLRHAAAPSPIERDLGKTLQPGQTEQVGVEFQAVEKGSQCIIIEVLSDGVVLASERQCVQVGEGLPSAAAPPGVPRGIPPGEPSAVPGFSRAPSPLQLRVLGPDVTRVGEMVEFVIDLTNPGPSSVDNIQLTCRVDPPLQPRFASGGFEPRRAGEVGAPFVWRRDTIPANQTVQYRLQCTAAQPATQACLIVEVTTGDGTRLSERRCVAITTGEREVPSPTPGGPSGQIPSPSQRGTTLPKDMGTETLGATPTPGRLQLTITPLRKDVRVGQTGTLVIRVSGSGRTPDRDVRVTVRLAPELQRVKFGTLGPPGAEDATFENSTIRFPPLSELAAGGTAEYRVVVLATRPGEARATAEVTSRESPVPITATTSILVTEGN
jgi:uncharacterized repeat protein (TIGR01451 family)